MIIKYDSDGKVCEVTDFEKDNITSTEVMNMVIEHNKIISDEHIHKSDKTKEILKNAFLDFVHELCVYDSFKNPQQYCNKFKDIDLSEPSEN